MLLSMLRPHTLFSLACITFMFCPTLVNLMQLIKQNCCILCFCNCDEVFMPSLLFCIVLYRCVPLQLSKKQYFL